VEQRGGGEGGGDAEQREEAEVREVQAGGREGCAGEAQRVGAAQSGGEQRAHAHRHERQPIGDGDEGAREVLEAV
jgi:hypothetical protein